MGSVEIEIPQKIIIFSELWDNYPQSENQHIDKKTNKVPEALDNHCAMNLSESLIRSGVSLKKYPFRKCWSCPSGKDNTHAISAEELAKWLKKRPFKGCGEPIELTGKTFKSALANKTGIIYFEDYWQRSNEKETDRRTGDHIDLWDDNVLAGQGSFFSFARLTLGISYDGTWSNYKLSKKVIFWEVK